MTHEDLHLETNPTPLTNGEFERIQTLADRGDDEAVLAYLHTHDLYEHVHHRWSNDRLSDREQTMGDLLTGMPLTQKDHDRLLVQWLHHQGTGWHAAKTGELVRVVLDHSRELLQAIEREGVTRDEVLRSACLHDEGKKSIPRSVLATRLTDEECWGMLQELYTAADTETSAILATLAAQHGMNLPADASWETLRTTLEKDHVRPVRAIPVRQILRGEPDVLDTLRARGCPVERATLLDVIGEHERFTRERLKDEPRIAEIAGHHHTPHESTFPMAAGTVGAGSRVAQEILYAADVIEALTAERDYKRAWSLTRALCTEIEETLSGSDHLSDFVTYQVVSVLMHHSNQVSLNNPDASPIRAYLAEHDAAHDAGGCA